MARSLPILPAEVFDYACAMTSLAVHEYAIGCVGSAVPVAFWTFSTAQASNLTHAETSRGSHLLLPPGGVWGGRGGRRDLRILLNVGCLLLLTLVLVHVIQKHEQDAAEETIDIAWDEKWMRGGRFGAEMGCFTPENRGFRWFQGRKEGKKPRFSALFRGFSSFFQGFF